MPPDHFPSLTAGDINQAAELLGIYGTRLDDYPPDAKEDLIGRIRRIVRRMQAIAQESANWMKPVHPALVEFVEKADRDCPEVIKHAQP
jgi:hypothetical protein